MKRLVATSLAISVLSLGALLYLVASAWRAPEKADAVPKHDIRYPTITTKEISMVSPALDRYTQDTVRGGLWKRSGLSPRDRGIVTLAALVARNQTVEMPYYLDLALDSGVKPGEVSEIITHLAFYSGWLANGTMFDTNVGGAVLTYQLSGLIPGWQSGLLGLKVGGKRRLVIPSSLAYGASGSGPIPPYANLVFDVELTGLR